VIPCCQRNRERSCDNRMKGDEATVFSFKSIEEEYQEEEQRTGMTSMFGPRIGTWLVSSAIDSRWNNSGRGFGLVVSGGPDEMQQWIDQCEKEYGDKPKDLERSFMKD